MTNATKLNAVDAAIQAAKEQASKTPSEAPTIDVYPQTQPGSNVQHYAPARAMTIDDVSSYSLDVDAFVKVTEHGLEIKGKNGLVESLRVSIDTSLRGLAPFEGVRYGNPAVYLKSYDRVKCATGGSWADALEKVRRIDGNIRPYEGADIKMVALEDIKNMKGEVVAAKGTLLGHSTSITNKANLVDFFAAIKDAGLRDEVVEVIISSERRTNNKGNAWGVLSFKLVGQAGEPAAE